MGRKRYYIVNKGGYACGPYYAKTIRKLESTGILYGYTVTTEVEKRPTEPHPIFHAIDTENGVKVRELIMSSWDAQYALDSRGHSIMYHARSCQNEYILGLLSDITHHTKYPFFSIGDALGQDGQIVTQSLCEQLAHKIGQMMLLQDEGRPCAVTNADRDWYHAIRIYLENGGDPNVRPFICNKDTLLHVVARSGNALKTLKILFDYGADPNGRNEVGATPLFSILSPVYVRRFLEAGAQPNLRNIQGETALFHAYDHRVLKALLEGGGDPNLADYLGFTPLFHADTARKVRTLLSGGADPSAVAIAGQSVLDAVSASYGDTKWRKRLIEKALENKARQQGSA